MEPDAPAPATGDSAASATGGSAASAEAPAADAASGADGAPAGDADVEIGEAEVIPPAAPDPADELKRVREQLLRTAADFDNFRKRTRREVSDAVQSGREAMLRDLLPVFDNLDRAAAHASTATDVTSLADGVRMVLKLFEDTLERAGIARVASVGSPFDPAVHEAIQQVESDAHPPGSVALEIQPGYRFGTRLVRPALVAVARPPAPRPAAPPETDGSPDAN